MLSLASSGRARRDRPARDVFLQLLLSVAPLLAERRLALRGMLNIPMEAFEEFCRAKTNFYIFEKVGHVETAFDSSAIPKKTTAKKEAGK